MSLLQNADFLTRSFNKDSFPPLPCPACSRPMSIKADSISSYETAQSVFLSDKVGAIAPYERIGVFTLFLECRDPECLEHVAVSGEASNECINRPDGMDAYVPVYDIWNCFPAIHLFPLSKAWDEQVKGHMLNSFSHFWNDPSSSGNSLRCAIEALMDYCKIPQKRRTQNGKMHRLTLHERIEAWGSKNKDQHELSQLLLAIKWIGNAGSHKAALSKKDLIKGYQLTEHVFSEVFDKRTKSLKNLAKRVNRRRGPTK